MRTVKQGDTVPVALLVVRDGEAVDLAGMTVSAEAAPQSGGESQPLGASIDDPAEGKVSITTGALAPGFYNVELTLDGPQGIETAPTGRYLAIRVLPKV